ncbi:uncharacterized protein DS421_4g113340 [Arachis hypogaea]|nr:uncharacterized protein DS421_4g113340 [Arachis hypogaea]
MIGGVGKLSRTPLVSLSPSHSQKHGKEERENQKWRLGQKERRRGGKNRRRRLGIAAVTAGLPHARSAAVEAAPFIPAQSRFCHHHPVPSPEECHEGERKLVRAGERKEALVGRRTLPSIAIEPRRTQNCEREGCDAGADTRKRERACAHRRRAKLLSPSLVSCAAVDLAAETVAVLYGRADERDLKVCWESNHRAQPLFTSPVPPRSELPPSEKGSGHQGWFSTPGTTAGVSGYFFRCRKNSTVTNAGVRSPLSLEVADVLLLNRFKRPPLFGSAVSSLWLGAEVLVAGNFELRRKGLCETFGLWIYVLR